MAKIKRESKYELSEKDGEAIAHLKDAVAGGAPWHVALLEAIGLWTSPEEYLDGRRYVYLIDGEAFDWVLLAERLSREIADMVPAEERESLIFHGRLPVEVTDEEFKGYVGDAKYHAYLNYLYGVTVEKLVQLAVEEEIAKERHGLVFSAKDGGQEDGCVRVYGATERELLQQFRGERSYAQGASINQDELKEFSYWLFKYRLRNSDKARVASDTKKGLDYLRRHSAATGLGVPPQTSVHIIEQRP